MRESKIVRAAVVVASLAAAAIGTPAAAQETPTTPPAPISSAPAKSGLSDRLFLAFAQDTAIVTSQWWEGQVEYSDGSSGIPVDAFIVRGQVAFRPIKSLEVGGNVGLGNTDAPAGVQDGTGATDLEIFGKWVFTNAASNLDWAAGAVATVPTGDDSVGLGFNSFALQAFGAMRYKLEGGIKLGGHIGVRYNGDGEFQTVDINGDTSFEVGVMALFQLANEVTLVTEGNVESKRFEGADSVANLLVGVDWKAFQRGVFRGAVSAGLTDSSPDYRIVLGYAYTF